MFTSREFADLNGLLASAVERGLGLGPALALLGEGVVRRPLREALGGVSRAISEGASFPEALDRYPAIFSAEYRALVKAGVTSGRLAEVLRQVQAHHDLMARLKSRANRVLLYFLCGAFLAEILLVVVLVLGKRTQQTMTESWTMDLGNYRGMSELATGINWILILAIPAGLVMLALVFRLIQRWAPLSWVGYILPVWGRLQKSHDLALFCTTLSLRLRSGLALPESLAAAESVLVNRRARSRAARLKRRVMDGERLSGALFYESFFPRTLGWAVSLAEARGEVPQVFDSFARLYSSQLERNYELLFQVLTPLGILVMGNLALIGALYVLIPFIAIMNVFTGLAR